MMATELQTLLLRAINDRPDGDVLNIMQVAVEYEGSLFDRLSKAYAEITGTFWGDPDKPIGLKDPNTSPEPTTGPTPNTDDTDPNTSDGTENT